jgi:hypothetical protein
MVGITLNRGAMKRWIVAQSDRSSVTQDCMKMAGIDPTKRYVCKLSATTRIQNNFINFI